MPLTRKVKPSTIIRNPGDINTAKTGKTPSSPTRKCSATVTRLLLLRLLLGRLLDRRLLDRRLLGRRLRRLALSHAAGLGLARHDGGLVVDCGGLDRLASVNGRNAIRLTATLGLGLAAVLGLALGATFLTALGFFSAGFLVLDAGAAFWKRVSDAPKRTAETNLGGGLRGGLGRWLSSRLGGGLVGSGGLLQLDGAGRA